MENSRSFIKRITALYIVFLAIMSVMTARLIDLQLINGKEYAEKSERRISSFITIPAGRGEILDRNGTPLITNKQVFEIYFIYSYWNTDKANDVILSLFRIMQDQTASISDSLPITAQAPFRFVGAADSDDRVKLSAFIEKNFKISAESSADEVLAALGKYYNIPESYSKNESRKVIGVRYEMEKCGFSYYNSFTFASGVSIETVSAVKENHDNLPGVDVRVSTAREYRTKYAAHILGRTGVIWKEEYEKLKEQGYPMNAIIGRDGMEKSLESYLRGIDGQKNVVTTAGGKLITETIVDEPSPGDNCFLTIDIALQEVAENSLAENINRIKQAGLRGQKGGAKDIEGGAAVVIDVNSGEILALANYPTYDLENFNKDYQNLLNDPLKPMINRAVSGIYPPGSTFKMVTAVAALEEGIVTPSTLINDTGVYMYYAPSYTPRCWYYKDYGRGHGKLNVSGAIEKSCNYFFYETGRLLGIERINKYAKLLGLGQKTGIELSGEKAGILAGPEHREKTGGKKWQPGETIQAAIGQSEQSFTPLQLAAYVATLVNGGTYYRPHLLKTVKSYDYKDTVLDNQPEKVSSIEIKYENYKAIMDGMRSVTEDGTASSVFRNFPIAVGGKTGSAQTRAGRSAHGVFVAFAPFENPEIAVCVIGEHAGSGNQMAWVARDIFKAYFANRETVQTNID